MQFLLFIDTVLRSLSFSYAYIDDVLIASSSEEEHKHHLQLVFECFKEYGVLASVSFVFPHFNSCGMLLMQMGSAQWPLKSKVSAVLDFSCPSSQWQLREFHGMINFYYRFIPHYPQVLQPLHTLLTHTHAKSELQWSECCVSAINAAKKALAQARLLFHPIPDAPTAMTDALDVAVGAVLQQFVNNHGNQFPIFPVSFPY